MDIKKQKEMMIDSFSKLFLKRVTNKWLLVANSSLDEIRKFYKIHKEVFNPNDIEKLKKYAAQISRLSKRFPRNKNGTTYLSNINSNRQTRLSRRYYPKTIIGVKSPVSYKNVSNKFDNLIKDYLSIPDDRNPYKIPSLNSDKYNTFAKIDDFEKQFIDEGIGGTREENKRMRGQIFSDLKKRSRGDE